MSLVKNAPRTATTIVVRSDANTRISHSRDPYYNLMRRIFQEDSTAVREQKTETDFLLLGIVPGYFCISAKIGV